MTTAMYTSLPSHVTPERVREQWDELTPDEVEWTDGKTHRLIHALVTRYGISRDEAARQIVEFLQNDVNDDY